MFSPRVHSTFALKRTVNRMLLQSIAWWIVCPHLSRPSALLVAEKIPIFWDLRSAATVESQVIFGLPWGFGGQVPSVLVVSRLATCPNSGKHLLAIVTPGGGLVVIFLISLSVTRSHHRMQQRYCVDFCPVSLRNSSSL